MGKLLYAGTEMRGTRGQRLLDLTVAWMGEHSGIEKLSLPANHPGPGDHMGLPDAFAATPQNLIESWRVAQRIDAATQPGDTVLVIDRDGLAGVFALEQAMRLPSDRCTSVVVAGESTYLKFQSHAATASGLSPEDTSAVDWELASYQWADVVITPSAWVRDQLAALGVDAVLMNVAGPESAHIAGPVQDVWLPEPVVRTSRPGTILRAINMARLPIPTVTMSEDDGVDEVWVGNTWDALDGIRLVHRSRIVRSDEVATPDLIILGDRTAVPSAQTVEHVAAGVPVIVPEGSTAAGIWHTAPVWRDTADLVAVLDGDSLRPTISARAPSLVVPDRSPDEDRARRISVGVPVFRDTRHLDTCLESILNQSVAPVEVLIYDDGSNLESVDEALHTWVERDDRVRVLTGPNQGVCAARNHMLESMVGDAFLLVDADDMLHPSFLKKTSRALQANPDIVAVSTWTRFFGTYEAVEAKPPFDARVGKRENPIISTCVLVDMSVRDQGVRFAPDLAWLYCEDWHVWSQIIAAGGRFGLIPEPLAMHRVHSSGGHRRTDLAYSLGKARATEPLS
ncbi:MAG: glycosyltransferase family 2 protein [Acidimicrobiia bacterium]|nr:glycosyltransferase family 2 protein [Acidimicrobiia bacterium]